LDLLGEPAPERYNQSGFTGARVSERVAVASAGPYANLHLALRFYRPDAVSATHPTASKH